MLKHDLPTDQARWEGFGWHTICVNGHNHPELLKAFAEAAQTHTKPNMILAKTVKGKDIPFAEDHPGWHGKSLNAQQAEEEITSLNQTLPSSSPQVSIAKPIPVQRGKCAIQPLPPPTYEATDLLATREAFGETLGQLREVNSRVVELVADVKNSAYTDKFWKRFPDRLFKSVIAEQNMVGTAAGLAQHAGKFPWPPPSPAFSRVSRISSAWRPSVRPKIKLMGSHVGVSIGEDGPSQMRLEDLAMMAAQPGVVVLYPSDACAPIGWLRNHGQSPGHGVHANRASQNPGILRRRGTLHDWRLNSSLLKRQGSVNHCGRRGHGLRSTQSV